MSGPRRIHYGPNPASTPIPPPGAHPPPKTRDPRLSHETSTKFFRIHPAGRADRPDRDRATHHSLLSPRARARGPVTTPSDADLEQRLGPYQCSKAEFHKYFGRKLPQQLVTTGICYFLASSIALAFKENFEAIMRSSFKVLPKRFPWSQRRFAIKVPLGSPHAQWDIIRDEDLMIPISRDSKTRQPAVLGPIGWHVLVAAYIKLFRSHFNLAAAYGGFSHIALEHLFGNAAKRQVRFDLPFDPLSGANSFVADDINSFLENFGPNTLATAFSLAQPEWDTNESYTAQGRNFWYNHAYAIIKVEKSEVYHGGYLIHLRDPLSPEEPIVLAKDEFLASFGAWSGVELNL